MKRHSRAGCAITCDDAYQHVVGVCGYAPCAERSQLRGVQGRRQSWKRRSPGCCRQNPRRALRDQLQRLGSPGRRRKACRCSSRPRLVQQHGSQGRTWRRAGCRVKKACGAQNGRLAPGQIRTPTSEHSELQTAQCLAGRGGSCNPTTFSRECRFVTLQGAGAELLATDGFLAGPPLPSCNAARVEYMKALGTCVGAPPSPEVERTKAHRCG